MADAALKTEAPQGAENFSAKPPTAEAAKPVGPAEANIAGNLAKMGGENTPDPDKSLLSIMSGIGGESTLANEKTLQQTDKRAETNLSDKMANIGGESTLAGEDSLKQGENSDKTNVFDLKTGLPLTAEQVGDKAQQVEASKTQANEQAGNDNENLDPNAETKEQKMQRLNQELSDNRKKYVEATRWFGSSTASGEINKDDSERAYKDSLKSYREAKMADVQEQIASDPGLREKPEGSDKSGADKLIEDTLREFTIGEFKNLQEDDAEIRLQKRKENLGEWGANAIDKVKGMLESYRKMKAWKKIGLSVTANILTGGSASIVLRGLGIAASSAAYKEVMEGKAESMRDTRWENVNQEGISEAQTENGLDIDKVKDFLNNQSDNMADKFQQYKTMRFARTVGSIGAAVGISVGGSYAFRELMQTDTAQTMKDKAVDVAQNINQELNPFHVNTVASAEPQPGDQVLPTGKVETTPSAGTESATPSVEASTPPAAETISAKTYDVQRGDNIWKIVDKALGDQKLNDGQRTYAIDEIKDKFAKMTPEQLKAIGISSGDINKLSVDDNIDLKSVFGEKGGAITIATEHAQNISGDQVASIEQNNDKISDFFGRNKGVEMTGENIDKVLQGNGDSLITPDDATSAAEDAVKKAGEKIGNIADLEQKAKDVLGQYGQRRAGESDSVYIHRVNEAARMMGVDLYSNAPKADSAAVISDTRSGAASVATTDGAGQGGGTPKAPEGGVDWSKPPEGYEPRVQPPAENQPTQSEPVKTYTASAGAGRATNFEGYGVKIANDGQGNIRTEGSDWSAYQKADGSSGFKDENISSSRDAAGNVRINTNRGAGEAFTRVSKPDAYNSLSSEPRGSSDEIKIPGQITDKEARTEARAARKAGREWSRFFYREVVKDAVEDNKFLSRAARKIFRG